MNQKRKPKSHKAIRDYWKRAQQRHRKKLTNFCLKCIKTVEQCLASEGYPHCFKGVL